MKLADLIRNMTDEEMAEFFRTEIFDKYGSCNICPASEHCRGKLCQNGLLDWIQSHQVSKFLYRVERRIQEEQERGKEVDFGKCGWVPQKNYKGEMK